MIVGMFILQSSGPTHDGPSVGSTPHKSPDKMHLKDFVPTSYNGWEKHVSLNCE